MKNHWELFIHLHHHHHDHDDGRDRCLSSTDPLLLKSLRLWSRLTSLVHHSKHIFLPPISASRLPFARFSKLPADCLSHIKTNFPDDDDDDDHPFSSPNPFFFTHHKPNLMGAFFPQRQYLATLFFHAISTVKHLFKRPDDVQMLPFLSLASAIITPIANLTSIMLAIPPADASVHMLGSLNQTPCDVQHRGGLGHSLPDLNWIRRAVEPITGIEFPGILNNILAKENQSNLSSEVLVGTGSRIVTIIKIRSLKVYAFGFYVHPYSVCQKLSSKYASVPASELKDHNEFYADLLREDIGMTVRLVINCSGMKINAVKELRPEAGRLGIVVRDGHSATLEDCHFIDVTFEKSLRARLAKTNPETDFKCIETFGSLFTNDIPLPVGTIIDLRRTADGQLITEIGGNQIGAVHSRELCRAFFDMYLGEVPVSKEAKEEIGSNVASIVGRC